MIIAGVGCKRGAAAPEIEAALRAALARAGVTPGDLAAIATIARKESEAGIAATAAKFGIDLVIISATAARAATDRIKTRSERVLALTGLSSVAEAAALAAAGPASRLLCPRLAVGGATCALATTEPKS